VKAPTVLQGDFRVHDPALIRQDNTYYVFSTGDEHGLNQGTIQIRRSTDLATWQLVGTVFQNIPDWIGKAIGGTPPNLWAPDISYFNGKYHLYYLSFAETFVLKSEFLSQQRVLRRVFK